METIDVGGREWSVAEAESLVTWSDGGGLGDGSRPGLGAGDKLSREHVEALRDFCRPWVEVRRTEARMGETYLGGKQEHIAPSKVFVRRPRKPLLTFSDLKLGERFRWAGYDRYNTVMIRTLSGRLNTASWDHFVVSDQSEPVERVEDYFAG